MSTKEELNAPEEIKGVDDLKITRTDKPDEPTMEVDFEKIQDMIVFDEMGNKIRFGDIYKKQKTIIVFTRVTLCTCTFFLSQTVSARKILKIP